MDILYFKILMTLSLLIFTLGICVALIRRQVVWTIVGQIICFKAAIFASNIFLILFPEKAELFSVLVFTGDFFMILFALVGFSLLIRSKRFGGSSDLSELDVLKH